MRRGEGGKLLKKFFLLPPPRSPPSFFQNFLIGEVCLQETAGRFFVCGQEREEKGRDWGTGDLELALHTMEDLNRARYLIERAYQEN